MMNLHLHNKIFYLTNSVRVELFILVCVVWVHYLHLWSLRGECVLSLAFVLAREDVEVHLHVP
jgi:hypothetical protein